MIPIAGVERRTGRHARCGNGARALSLVEMMIVLAIVSVLVSAALPSFRDLLRSQSMKVASSQWIAALQRARAEAVRRGITVDILPVQSGKWSQGWVVAVDANRNRSYDRNEEVLYSYGPIAQSVSVTVNFASRPLQFHSSGRPLQSGHVLLATGSLQRKIIVNMLGRTRICDPSRRSGGC